MSQTYKIELGGRVLSYTLTRKKVKNINLRVSREGKISISAAKSVPLSAIEAFLRSKADWLRRVLENVSAERPTVPEGFAFFYGELVPIPDGESREAWQKRIAADRLPRAYEQAWLLFQNDGFPKPALRLRKMKSRWGSCIPAKAVITLNTALVGAPPDCQMAVAAHELCHMLHPNHSKEFYTALEQHLPDYKACREKLKLAQALLSHL